MIEGLMPELITNAIDRNHLLATELQISGQTVPEDETFIPSTPIFAVQRPAGFLYTMSHSTSLPAIEASQTPGAGSSKLRSPHTPTTLQEYIIPRPPNAKTRAPTRTSNAGQEMGLEVHLHPTQPEFGAPAISLTLPVAPKLEFQSEAPAG